VRGVEHLVEHLTRQSQLMRALSGIDSHLLFSQGVRGGGGHGGHQGGGRGGGRGAPHGGAVGQSASVWRDILDSVSPHNSAEGWYLAGM